MRTKEYLLWFWPLLFILGIWFVFAFPYFVQHKIPYPSQYQVSFFSPWNAYSQYSFPVKNNAISDVVDQLYPWKYFTIEQLQKGELPLWNPYSFAGNPHLANYQSAVFSPFNFLFFLFSFIDAWSLIVLVQPLLAGLFLYIYFRGVKVSQVGSLIGSIAFMFCGFLTVWMPYGTLGMSIAFLPLALFSIEKYVINSQIRYLVLLSVSIIVSFFSGHFQTSLYLVCFIFAYLNYSFFAKRKARAIWFTSGAIIVGIVISLIQIIPSLEFYTQSVRSELFGNNDAIPWYYVITVFAPDFFGNPVTRNDWLGHYAEWASFIGIIPFTLALVSIGSLLKRIDHHALPNRDNGFILFFFFTGITTLIFALDTPLQQLLSFLKIPIFSTSIPSRIIILFSFSFAVLSGFGFDFLQRSLKQQSLKKTFFFVLPTIVIMAIVWIIPFVPQILPKDKALLAKRNLLLPSVLFFTFVAFTFVTFYVKKQYAMITFAVILLLLTVFDSWRFVQKWMPFENRSMLFPMVPVIQAMQQDIGSGRVYGDFGAYVSLYYHLPVVDGYDPLYSKRYGEFIQSAKTGNFSPALRSEVLLDKRGKYTQRVLDILGVTLIYQPIAHSHQDFAFPVWEHPENFPTVYRDDKFAVFANKTVMPRVQLFSQYEVVSDFKKQLERFYASDFDYKNVLLLDEDPGLANSKWQMVNGKAEIVLYKPNKVIVSVTVDKPVLLFLSDSYYPGWRVKVNGKDEKIYRADYTLRAVKVPSGASTVEFDYNGLF